MAAEKNVTAISVKITAEEKEALKSYCEENDLTMSQVIRRAIKKYLEPQGD